MEYGLTSSVFSNDINEAINRVEALKFGEMSINDEQFEPLPVDHAGCRKSSIGGADILPRILICENRMDEAALKVARIGEVVSIMRLRLRRVLQDGS
jgi:hypothetical protein